MHVGDGVADDARRGMEPIQNLPRLHVHRSEPAVQRPVESHTASGGQRPTIVLERVIDDPLGLTRERIEGNEPPTRIAASGSKHAQGRSDVRKAGLVLDAESLIIHTDMVGSHVEELGPRIVRGGLVVLSAHSGWANVLDVDVGLGHLARVYDGTTCPHVDLLRPVHRRIKFVRSEKLAVAAIKHIGEAIAVKMGEGRNRFAVDFAIGEYTLVNAVVIPAIVRRHLIGKLGYAGVRIAPEEGHGPLVVAGALRGIPRARITGAVVEQVELRIVCKPAPRRAASEFPLISFPGLQAGILTHRLLGRAINGPLRINQHFLIRPRAVGAPFELARVEIVGGEVAADTVLPPRHTDDDFVTNHQRSAGHRLT